MQSLCCGMIDGACWGYWVQNDEEPPENIRTFNDAYHG